MRTIGIVLMCLVVLAASDARAQTTIGVAAGASRQEAGGSDIPYLGPPFGGTSAAVLGMIDFRLTGNMTIGGEGSLATSITGNQSQRTASATNAFTSRHSDSVSNVVFAYSFGGDVDVRVSPRIRVLGVVRWHSLLDDDLGDGGVVKRGVASRIIRAGAGVKIGI